MIERRAALQAIVAMAAGIGTAWHGAAAAQAVRVRSEAPIIERIEFDPWSPPAGMPKLTPPESGVCNTTFELATGVSYSVEPRSPTTVKVYVEELELVARVTFEIYTIKGAPAKLRAHEEAHRVIGEHYYKNAGAVAQQLGDALIGASFDGVGEDEDAAQRNGFDKVVAAIETAYMARIRIPSAAANVRFDDITKHGLSDIDEVTAIAMAIGADPEGLQLGLEPGLFGDGTQHD
jgi:hypothetical protein